MSKEKINKDEQKNTNEKVIKKSSYSKKKKTKKGILNGIAYLMAGKDSHFSGKDPDYNDHNSWKYARAMNCSSRSFRQFYRLKDNCKIKNIELINLSKSGLLDFIPKENFDNLFDN